MSRKATAAYCFVLIPSLVCLIAGAEFWPFTYFPMYSERAQVFDWPHVQVRTVDSPDWTDLIEERCFAPFGYVRYHFSVMKFHRLQRESATKALQLSLAKAISKNCQDRNWEVVRIEFRRHDLKSNSRPIAVTMEVPIAP
ncbi:MAG: hypothetical protein U1E10_11965 [Bdellovibrionales bacterium]|nr:hypothetical protein [Bdellovibrionales bacterium]